MLSRWLELLRTRMGFSRHSRRSIRRKALLTEVSLHSTNVEELEDRRMLSRHSVLAPAETASVITPRILNGTPIDNTEFPAVGIVGDRRDLSGFGTGTLIDTQWVLTAGHVSRGVGNKAGRFILDGVIYETVRVIDHPKFRFSKLGTDKANDLALWKLASPITGVTPNLINRAAPIVGEDLTLVGFGSGGDESGEIGDFGTKRQGTTPLDDVSETLISWDFNHPGESNTGHGDSGGPAFITRNGTLFVAGVTSGGEKTNAALGDHSYDTRIDVFAGWIDATIAKFNQRNTADSTPPTLLADSDASDAPQRRVESRSVVPRIVNGTPIPESTFPSVGKINSVLGQATATLIAPQWILTAGHCSAGLNNTGGTFEIGGETYNSTRVVVHPKFKASKLGKNGANDIALWKLDRVVMEIAPSVLMRQAPKVGQTLTLVGYGLGGDQNGATGQYGTKRQGDTRLDRVSSKILRWNFDIATEANTAGGDSGGPAFVLVSGSYQLAGITSGGAKADSSLGDKAADTRVDAYTKWIDSILQLDSNADLPRSGV